LSVLENVPAAHGVQVRSLVAEPDLAKKPGEHWVHGTHALAGFASSSQVPALHTTRGEVSPAQYCPALQRSHWGGTSS
jgi:hypothetical protein